MQEAGNVNRQRGGRRPAGLSTPRRRLRYCTRRRAGHCFPRQVEQPGTGARSAGPSQCPRPAPRCGGDGSVTKGKGSSLDYATATVHPHRCRPARRRRPVRPRQHGLGRPTAGHQRPDRHAGFLHQLRNRAAMGALPRPCGRARGAGVLRRTGLCAKVRGLGPAAGLLAVTPGRLPPFRLGPRLARR